MMPEKRYYIKDFFKNNPASLSDYKYFQNIGRETLVPMKIVNVRNEDQTYQNNSNMYSVR